MEQARHEAAAVIAVPLVEKPQDVVLKPKLNVEKGQVKLVFRIGEKGKRLVLIKKKLHIPIYRALYIDRMLGEHNNLVTSRDRIYRGLVKNFKIISDSDYDVPKSLEDILRLYQAYGFKWLSTLQDSGFGGILADEMGLGKTIQAISLLLKAKENGNKEPSLIVCPASLVFYWVEKCGCFAPD